MKSAKLGALFLISIMALAGIGAGYASWTDTITVSGTVNTGSVDIDVVHLSGTWVWKYPDHNTQYWHGWATTSTPPSAPSGSTFEASASADFVYDAAGDKVDEIVITTSNLFPCQWFMVDFLIHYVGTVPGRINALTIDSGNALLMQLYDDNDIGYAAYEWLQTTDDIEANGPGGTEYMGPAIDDLHGYQLHDCDWIYVKLWIHIPQDSIYMGLSADFTASLGVIQWNLYVD